MSDAAKRRKHARPLTTLTAEQLAKVTGGSFKPGDPGLLDDGSLSLKPGDPQMSGTTEGGFKPGGPG
jgi:hypothetical protein